MKGQGIFGVLNFYVFLCVLYFCAGCGSPSGQNSTTETSSVKEFRQFENSKDTAITFKPFYVFLDKGSRLNHYVPSGFMPNGKCIVFDDQWQDNCQSGETCIKIFYDVVCSRKDEKWAGIYWLHPANNWGKRKGGFDLSGAKQLTFWARGENGGEQIQEVTIGGISGDYPDSDMAVIGPIILTKEWRQYAVDLSGKDLSSIIGGFSWTTSEDVNPEGCAFYLDNIRYE